ncbi:MAG: TetR/AcrR family transcriptional regulator [Actinomycetota bacterium]|jgi:AcrR family transcriptional regulator
MARTTEPAARTPGRPRSAQAEQAILDAALAAFIEHGYEGMSVEAVAERAGVGKTTIYRRWPSKQELVVAALDTLLEDVHPTATGDTEADLVALVGRAHDFITRTKAGEVLPRMIGELAAGTPLGRAYFDKVMRPRLGELAALFEDARARGELRSDLDVDLALAAIIGSMMFLRVTRTLPKTKGTLPDRLIGQLLDGLRA